MPLSKRLFDDVDSLVLVFMRFSIGVAILFWAWSHIKPIEYGNEMLPTYDVLYLKPSFLFKYGGFEWVKLWPGNGIAWHFYITMVFSIMLAVGFLTRISSMMLCTSIAYVLLVERQIYLNHYYLLACLAGLMVFLPAGRRLSIDSRLGIERRSDVFKRWQLWLLRFQIGIPYVYGAIAKMNTDWMSGQPAGIYLEERRHLFWIADLYLQLPVANLMFAWGGLVYDLAIVPMLLHRKTRLLGILMSLVFHLSNSQLFRIGVFPWFMLAGLIVFLPEDSIAILAKNLRSVGRSLFRKNTDSHLDPQKAPVVSHHLNCIQGIDKAVKGSGWGRVGFSLAVFYVVIQLLLPFRHWMLPGNPAWNERGHRFAWRMMLRRKCVLTTFKVVTPDGQYQFFPSTHFLTYNQSVRGERNPELVRQTAVQIKKKAAEAGFKDAKVYCLCLASLNGRRPVPIIDPNIDLSVAKRGWLKDSWVMQDHGALPKRTWNQDKTQWWTELMLPERFKPLERRLPSELDAYIRQQQKQQQSPRFVHAK